MVIKAKGSKLKSTSQTNLLRISYPKIEFVNIAHAAVEKNNAISMLMIKRVQCV